MPTGINVTAAAIAGLVVLLLTGVLSWDDCLGNKSAWNTFTWFAAVIAFATQLKSLGFVRPRFLQQRICKNPRHLKVQSTTSACCKACAKDLDLL